MSLIKRATEGCETRLDSFASGTCATAICLTTGTRVSIPWDYAIDVTANHERAARSLLGDGRLLLLERKVWSCFWLLLDGAI